MGPPESLTSHGENQAVRRKRSTRRPRARCCLLKDCERRFHPQTANQRYCSADCRQAAQKWSRWKAQQRYRKTAVGEAKRNDQSRRYRERVKNRKPPDPEGDNEAARVITPEHFFRAHVRPARVLRALRSQSAKSLAALLLARLPERHGARSRTGASLETGTDLKPEILIRNGTRLKFSLSDATGVSPTRPSLGALTSTPSGAAGTAVGIARRERPADAHRGGCDRWQARPLRGDRRLQAHHGAAATWPGQSGSSGVADERTGGHRVGSVPALIGTRIRTGGGVAPG
jgi:hypothetical protein